jgi:hypothetical protein
MGSSLEEEVVVAASSAVVVAQEVCFQLLAPSQALTQSQLAQVDRRVFL